MENWSKEWSFIEVVLFKMGYPRHMVELILKCVSMVSYQILVNGHPGVSFKPERGLR